jgi:hypothetical protein
MALPKMQSVLYNTTVPSTKKEVKFRPFLVKEEKALLLAQQSEDPKVMVDTLKQIIKDCIKDDIDIDRLAIFDYEYLFTQFRAKSVGEFSELVFLCDDCDDEKARININIDLTKSKVDFPEGHTNKINLFDDVGIMMKYPSLDTIQDIRNVKEGDIISTFNLIKECVDYIYNSEQVFHTDEQSKEDVIDFLESLTQEQFAKIEKFFETMPKLSQPVEYTCPVCNKHHDKVLEGINYFF